MVYTSWWPGQLRRLTEQTEVSWSKYPEVGNVWHEVVDARFQVLLVKSN